MGSEVKGLSIISGNSAPAPQVPAPLMPYRGERGIDADTIQFGEIRKALRRTRLLILLMTGVGAAVGLYLGYTQAPVYEARAVMEIQGNSEPGFRDSASAGERPEVSSLQMQTQLNLLRSKRMMDRVYDRLALSKSKEFDQAPDGLNWRTYIGQPPKPDVEAGMGAQGAG